MLHSWRRPAKLFTDFNTPQFASAMSMVVFVVLIIFTTMPTPHHGMYPDLPKVDHPMSMRAADREDTMRIFVLRDGKVYFGSEQVDPTDLPQRIADRLKDDRVERKVYVVADSRARWGTVKLVLDAAYTAGIWRVAFMVDQRPASALHM